MQYFLKLCQLCQCQKKTTIISFHNVIICLAENYEFHILISELCAFVHKLKTSFSFSFQELREVRVAFQLYEHEDMLGLAIDEHILLRTLKVIFI